MINVKDTALVVVDVQKGLFNKKTRVFREDELIKNINSLIDVFHENGMKVFFIRHTNKNLLAENTDDWQIHPKLHLQDYDTQLNKEHSSVFKEKILKNELDRLGIKYIVVAGLVTHGCVKAACQDAKKLGYEVTLAADGHSSFNENAESLIAEWNEKLAAEGINVLDSFKIIADRLKC